MLAPYVSDLAARYLPRLASGHAFHLRALAAAARGHKAAAERWFALAIVRYRRDLAIEPLARLRVHELMLGVRPGGGEPAADPGGMVEIVRRLNRLDQLEGLDSPHELADARSVLAAWVESHTDAIPPAGTVSTPSSSAA